MKNYNDNDKYDHCCYCCEYSSPILDGEQFLCKKKGVVSHDHACSSFIFDPLKKEVSVRFFKSEHSSEDFKI